MQEHSKEQKKGTEGTSSWSRGNKVESPMHSKPEIRTSTEGYDFVMPSVDYSEKTPRRMRTAGSGNPLISIVNTTGISEMEILYCLCSHAMPRHEQLLQAGLFPSTFEETETAFTFSVLDDFLADNLECKTTAQQYYSKLQTITNKMFPYRVPVCNIALWFSYAHMQIVVYRTYTGIYLEHHANGEIWQAEWKVELASTPTETLLKMVQWQYFVQHVLSLE